MVKCEALEVLKYKHGLVVDFIVNVGMLILVGVKLHFTLTLRPKDKDANKNTKREKY